MSNDSLIFLIIGLFALIIFSAFFSAAETAYSSVSKTKIEEGVNKKKRSALLIRKHHKSFGWTLATILICNNLVNITASALITFLFTKLIGATGEVTIISTFVMTPIIVIFGEIFPKLLAKKYSYGYLVKIAYIMEFINILLFPITYPLSKFALESKITNSETELKSLIKIAKKEGVLEMNEAELASKALDLDSTSISKVMVKKDKIISVKHNDKMKKIHKIFKTSGFSRLPVSKGGQFIGLIILKDVFMAEDNEIAENYIVDINKVSKHTLATRALEQMRSLKSHMVLVTEKQDSESIVGIVTIEDIIEELVGEIYDEHDEDISIREIAHFKWTVIGSALVKDVEKNIEYELEKNGEETIKQWLQSRINRKIKKGLKYTYMNKIQFKIISNRNNEETKIQIVKK